MSASVPPEIPVIPPPIPSIPPLPPMPPVQPYGPAWQVPPPKPNWPKVVGIVGIILGALGVIGGAQLMVLPQIMEFQKAMFSEMERVLEKQRSTHRRHDAPPAEGFEPDAPPDERFEPDERRAEGFEADDRREEMIEPDVHPEQMFKFVKKMWETPEWFPTWCMIGGPISMLISGFYLFASIRVLKIKPGAVGLFYSAAALGIALALAKVGVGVAMKSLMGVSVMMGGLIGGVADVVLIFVVATGGKEMFTAQADGKQAHDGAKIEPAGK